MDAVTRGPAATVVYLEAYQLILRKQLYALIHTIGLSSELETVVKNLWRLRLQLLKDKISDTSGDGTFSSQPGSETERQNSENKQQHPGKRHRKVKNDGLPTLIETLALCYMGCILLRLPVSIGDIHKYGFLDVSKHVLILDLGGHFEKIYRSFEPSAALNLS